VTGWTVFHVFLLCRILPLKARLASMWEHIELREQSAVADGHLLEESLTGVAWMVLGSMLGNHRSMMVWPHSRCLIRGPTSSHS
jgi:hypothetical protein